MKSWKTTSAGILAIIISVLAAVQAQFDNDPTTMPQWETAFAALIAGIGLLFARDNNVSSEKAGAK
jgi:hypothetical protein